MAEMSFYHTVAGCTVDRVRCLVTSEELLLLHIKPAEVAQFQLPTWKLPGEVFQAGPTLNRPLRKTQDELEGRYLSAGL